MNRFFNQKSILWTNCSNEANNDNDHNIIIIIVTFHWVERSHMMVTEKQCMVVKMNNIIYCLVISSKINNDYNECNLN